MDTVALISVLCEDDRGLIAAITGCLYEIGANLGDTTFAVLGGAAEFNAVCELPAEVSLASVEAELARLPALAKAKISVTPFGYHPIHAEQAHITHRIEITGKEVVVRLSKRAHNPLLKEAALTKPTGPVPWLAGRSVRLVCP